MLPLVWALPSWSLPSFLFLLFCLQKTQHCLVQCGCTQAKYISHLVFFNIEPENNSATKTLACLISIQYKQAALITCANTLVYKHWQSTELHCHWKARFCQGTDMGSEWNGSLPLRNKKNSASSNTTYHSNSSVTFFFAQRGLAEHDSTYTYYLHYYSSGNSDIKRVFADYLKPTM